MDFQNLSSVKVISNERVTYHHIMSFDMGNLLLTFTFLEMAYIIKFTGNQCWHVILATLANIAFRGKINNQTMLFTIQADPVKAQSRMEGMFGLG